VLSIATYWTRTRKRFTSARDRPDDKDYSVQRLLIGTHTSDNDQNFVEIAHVQLPRDDIGIDPRKYDDEKGGEQVITLLPYLFAYVANSNEVTVQK
jgi:hypothetical protein